MSFAVPIASSLLPLRAYARFGEFTAAGSSRIMQLALRLSY
jgi:hypothetical protein